MKSRRVSKANKAKAFACATLCSAHCSASSVFDASNNLAVYWGQNSYGQAASRLAQQPLATYCANTNVDIIPMAFLVQITSGVGGQPVINFANQGNNCTVFPGTNLLKCPNIGDDIITCQQKHNKTILLSIGGATYTEGGFASESAAEAAAELVWKTFGPPEMDTQQVGLALESVTVIAQPSLWRSHYMHNSSTHTVLPLSHKNETKFPTSMVTRYRIPTTPAARMHTSITKAMTEPHLRPTTSKRSTSTTFAHVKETTKPGDPTPSTPSRSTTFAMLQEFSNSQALTTSKSSMSTTFATLQKSTNPRSSTTSTLLTINEAATSPLPQATTASPTLSSYTPSTTSPPPAVTTNSADTLDYDVTHPTHLIPRASPPIFRPFGSASVDGFDLDLESPTTNFLAFALRLRALMNAAQSSSSSPTKQYYLTVAPQCPYPDLATESLLNGGVPFDAVFVQFYNNYCGLQSYAADTATQQNFNFQTWDQWARNGSANKDVKVFIGVPAAAGAAGTGYQALRTLKPIITYARSFRSFGGVMTWDFSQAYSHVGFLRGIKNSLDGKPNRLIHPEIDNGYKRTVRWSD